MPADCCGNVLFVYAKRTELLIADYTVRPLNLCMLCTMADIVMLRMLLAILSVQVPCHLLFRALVVYLPGKEHMRTLVSKWLGKYMAV